LSILLKLWLIFCQATTAFVALIFVISTLKPFWIETFFINNLDSELPNVVKKTKTTLDSLSSDEEKLLNGLNSLRYAASKAMPSVVHIYTSQKKTQSSNNLLLNDPLFKKFFNDNFGLINPNTEPKTGLGSGVIVNKNGNIIMS
jgi:S1-C subfamily serine protease